MLNLNAILYQRDTEDLSATQLNHGTSANVIETKKQLLIREIIDIREKEVSFIDPVYEHWFQ